jgi:hypothetical protein
MSRTSKRLGRSDALANKTYRRPGVSLGRCTTSGPIGLNTSEHVRPRGTGDVRSSERRPSDVHAVAAFVHERRRAQRRASSARRELHRIDTRDDFREQLSERDRIEFNTMSLKEQDLFQDTVERYPEYVPPQDTKDFD